LQGKCMHSCYQHMMAVADTLLQNEVVVSGAAQANSSTSTCRLMYETRLFQSSVWYTFIRNTVSISYTTCISATARGQKSLPQILLLASMQNCRWTWLYSIYLWTYDEVFTRTGINRLHNLHWMGTGKFLSYSKLFIPTKTEH
jgi:hypothetical protein